MATKGAPALFIDEKSTYFFIKMSLAEGYPADTCLAKGA